MGEELISVQRQRLLLPEQRKKIECEAIFNSILCLVEARIKDEALLKLQIITDVPCLE